MPSAEPHVGSGSAVTRTLVQQSVARLETLPAFFPVVKKALDMIEDERTTTPQLQRVLMTDQAVIGKLLRLANSAYFGVSSEVRTLAAAINIIGYAKVGLLLRYMLLSGLFEQLSTNRPGARLIRDTSVAVAAASREVAVESGVGAPEELSIAGLVHNIGDLALSWLFPNEYDAALKLGKELPRFAAQDEVFGVSSPLVGRWVLEAWRFPSFFPVVVEHWPNPLHDEPDRALRQSLCIVHVGVRLAEAQGLPPDGPALEIPAEALAEINLSPDALDPVRDRLPEVMTQIRAIMAG